jgi:hypothetical protein
MWITLADNGMSFCGKISAIIEVALDERLMANPFCINIFP